MCEHFIYALFFDNSNYIFLSLFIEILYLQMLVKEYDAMNGSVPVINELV